MSEVDLKRQPQKFQDSYHKALQSFLREKRIFEDQEKERVSEERKRRQEGERGRNQFRPSPPQQLQPLAPQQHRPPPPPLRRPKMEQDNPPTYETPALSGSTSSSPCNTCSGANPNVGTSTSSKMDNHNQGMDDVSKMEPQSDKSLGEMEFPEDNSGKTDFNNIDFNDTADVTSTDDNTDQNYTLTLTELDKSLPVSGTDDYHKVITKLNKENLILMQNNKILTEAVKIIFTDPNFSNSQYDETKQAVNECFKKNKDCIREKENEMKNVSDLSNEFRQVLQLPNFGANDKINIEEARLAVPLFSNETDSSKLQEFWQKLVCYSETEKLSEAAVKNLLSFLLQGRPYNAFYENKGKSLKDISKMLIDRFGCVSTINDKLKELDSITRGEKESLPGAMSRVAELIDSTKLVAREEIREYRSEMLMLEYLFKLASSKAKQEMLSHKSKALRSGYRVEYKDLLAIAIDTERKQQESNDPDLFAFPVVRVQKHRHHKEKPYGDRPGHEGQKSLASPQSPASNSPSNSAPAYAAPHFRPQNSNSKPFTQRYGKSDQRNINDHYRQNSNRDRNPHFDQRDSRPSYNYNDSYRNNNYDRQWDNRKNRSDYRNNFKPKIYQGYGNYARHKYPPYPMECGSCGIYHYGSCKDNYNYDKKYYNNNNNNRNDLN